MKIRLVVCDVDGVLTDGRLYYDRRGERMKAFHTRDGVAVGMLRERGIRVGVLTAKDNGIAEARARAVGMQIVGVGARDKLAALRRYSRMPLKHVAYIGDDVIDVEVMRAVGLAVAPRDASREARAAADWITKARGGEGVLREVAERLLR